MSLCEHFLLLLKLYLAGKKSFVSVNEETVFEEFRDQSSNGQAGDNVMAVNL